MKGTIMSEIKLNYHKTHFLTSAPNIRSIPEDTGIEIAFAGRSNAGKSTALNAILLPLNQVNLIEASAGTGKTYTIGSIYLRLLLQAGENCFSRPLNVEEILVVTFTEMATEDLKRKIRERLTAAISVFSEYYEKQDKSIFTGEHQFLAELLPYLEDIPTALRRLKLAEQNLDLASIYTIHGFCRRMLMQHAFNSGVHFNLKLLKDQSDLLKQFANEFWREHFYDLPFHLAAFISKELKSPEDVLNDLGSNIGNDFSIQLDRPELLELPLKEFLQKDIAKNAEIIEKINGNCTITDYNTTIENSACLSSDVGAAVDPNYESVYEKRNAAFAGCGMVLMKYTGARGKSESSDASAEFVYEIGKILDDNGVIWQTSELGKVDQGGGGTIAQYVANLNMDVIDCGVPVLSMHAPFEVTAKSDVYMAYKSYVAFYNNR